MSAHIPAPAKRPGGGNSARQRLIRSSLWFTVPGTYIVLGAAYAIVPPLAGMTQPSERLILAVQWLLVAFTPYAAVCLSILYLRYAEGAHNPLLGEESERLKVHCRVMQNSVFFAFARFLYWWGYLRRGTLSRAPGVQLTFLLIIPLLVYALVQFAKSLNS